MLRLTIVYIRLKVKITDMIIEIELKYHRRHKIVIYILQNLSINSLVWLTNLNRF